jgi:cobalt-zinc-cadmium efflux system membrane fusion protein
MPLQVSGLLARLGSYASTVFVLGILAGIAWWGQTHEWSFRGPEEKKEDKKKTDEGEDQPLDKRRVKLDAPDVAAKVGISWAPVKEGSLREVVTAPGELQLDPTQLAHLAPRATGNVWRVEEKGRLGTTVKRGDVLAYVESTDVAKAKSEFIQAMLQVENRTRVLDLAKGGTGMVSPRVLMEAEQNLREAKVQLFIAQQALLNLGLPLKVDDLKGLSEEELVKRLRKLGLPKDLTESAGTPTAVGTAELGPGAADDQATGAAGTEVLKASLLPIFAPFDGVVIRQDLVRGMVVGPSQPHTTVANLEHLWLVLDLLLEDSGKVKQGQRVTLRPDGLSDLTPEGIISWISPAADEKTRTVKARAVVPNSSGLLRANVLGTASIVVREASRALTVPVEAVQYVVSQPILFVHVSDEEFETRVVRLGARLDGYWEVVEGLQPGEEVVVTGAHLLKSELFKSRIGGED